MAQKSYRERFDEMDARLARIDSAIGFLAATLGVGVPEFTKWLQEQAEAQAAVIAESKARAEAAAKLKCGCGDPACPDAADLDPTDIGPVEVVATDVEVPAKSNVIQFPAPTAEQVAADPVGAGGVDPAELS